MFKSVIDDLFKKISLLKARAPAVLSKEFTNILVDMRCIALGEAWSTSDCDWVILQGGLVYTKVSKVFATFWCIHSQIEFDYYFSTRLQKCSNYEFFTLVVHATKRTQLSCILQALFVWTCYVWAKKLCCQLEALYSFSEIVDPCQFIESKYFYNQLSQPRVTSYWLQPLAKNNSSITIEKKTVPQFLRWPTCTLVDKWCR